ncbi:DUF523 domain-containing protein [Caldicellulosiruptor naganoensis]|uniref:DUF523 domain-containing protein n=1 Tax=Caldicellulosiruptor naganoensis TaxID=29324 RepID=A0ABY7BDU3_9FIRM|nr:DUF523 domain-containing protein [Caldicellulosiruptor naganoensis]WAM30978.1 DUF523 domain-containing protein [Caldicellulosiruptor naganoensis]
MKFALISSCLIGLNTKYDGTNNLRSEIVERLKKEYILIPVCPEQLGGLPTPRNPCEIKDGRVFDIQGRDLTDNFYRGAIETLKVARFFGADIAFLKSKSPSCGFGKVYDGSFSKKLVDGIGITAKILGENGIEIVCID